MKKLVFICLVLVGSIVADVSSRPAMPTIKDANSDIEKKLFKCKVPDFLWQLPPMMVADFKECVNVKFKPSRKLVELRLKQYVNRKAVLLKVEPLGKFYSRVYRVWYKEDNHKKRLVCNHTMTYCLKDEPVINLD